MYALGKKKAEGVVALSLLGMFPVAAAYFSLML
jgi:hypothetical protein